MLITATDTSIGLIAYYPFNGNANDESGYGNNGTINGATAVADKSGKASSAYSFDGYTKYINVKNGAILGSSANFTVAAWVKWDGGGPAAAFEEIYCEGSSNDIIDLCLVDGVPEFIVLGSSWVTLKAPAAITVNTWHYIAAVLQSGVGGKIYVDGQLAGTDTNMLPAGQLPYETDIGRFVGNGGSRYFSGVIDEVRVYNRALSPSEVQLIGK